MQPLPDDFDEDDYSDLFSVSLSIYTELTSIGDDRDYISEVSGDISVTEEYHKAGTISAYLVQVDRIQEHGHSVLDVCDDHDQTLAEYSAALFDPRTNRPRRAVTSIVGLTDSDDLLILDQIEVLPAYRGRNVGLRAAHRILHVLGRGRGIAACRPIPMQFTRTDPSDAEWRATMAADSLPGSHNAALRKLHSHWARLGFNRVPRSPYRALCLETSLPELDSLLRST